MHGIRTDDRHSQTTSAVMSWARTWGAPRRWLTALLAAMVLTAAGLAAAPPAGACGGFFCVNTPVDQNAERIIFTQNGDGTVSAYVQIEYTGSAPDFSWILPLPEAIDAEAVEVPEDAMAAFRELESATNPNIIPPPMPRCRARVEVIMEVQVERMVTVTVFASGEVGPYGFDVVGSEDPDALITWLRENSYRVTEPMEPLIDLYVEEQFVFLAMKLRPDQGAQDVEPVKVTYPSTAPMIPLRLTAVAANPNMAVLVWIYADRQATPVNYAKMEIANEELRFDDFGGHNYRQLMSARADEYGGQAFITEYAAPSRELRVNHPLLRELGQRFPYVTRLNTVISPDEMTVDPVFAYDGQLKDVSNVRDLRGMTGVYECEREEMARQLRAVESQEAWRLAAAKAREASEARSQAEAAAATGAAMASAADDTAADGEAAAAAEEPLAVGTLVVGVVLGVLVGGGGPGGWRNAGTAGAGVGRPLADRGRSRRTGVWAAASRAPERVTSTSRCCAPSTSAARRSC